MAGLARAERVEAKTQLLLHGNVCQRAFALALHEPTKEPPVAGPVGRQQLTPFAPPFYL